MPFERLMCATSFAVEQREWMGKARSFYATTFGAHQIWGATAGILRVLYEELFA